jgi:hypothetical protein
MTRAIVPFLIGSVALTQACAAQPVASQSFGFVQTDSGRWEAVSIDKLQDYLVASKVVCEPAHSEIDVVWNAESGDWAAFDKYSSTGPFFTRIIRFAQFDDTIQIVKERPNSRPTMTIGGDDVEQYDYLLKELSIWTRRSEFPYDVPRCAAEIFRHR